MKSSKMRFPCTVACIGLLVALATGSGMLSPASAAGNEWQPSRPLGETCICGQTLPAECSVTNMDTLIDALECLDADEAGFELPQTWDLPWMPSIHKEHFTYSYTSTATHQSLLLHWPPRGADRCWVYLPPAKDPVASTFQDGDVRIDDLADFPRQGRFAIRVVCEKNGEYHYPAIHRWLVALPEAGDRTPFSFLITSDVQTFGGKHCKGWKFWDCISPQEMSLDRFYEIVSWANLYARRYDLSFAVDLGDIAEDPNNSDRYRHFRTRADLLGVPWYVVAGNHEVNERDKADFDLSSFLPNFPILPAREKKADEETWKWHGLDFPPDAEDCARLTAGHYRLFRSGLCDKNMLRRYYPLFWGTTHLYFLSIADDLSADWSDLPKYRSRGWHLFDRGSTLYRWLFANLKSENPAAVDARIALSHAGTECWGGGVKSIDGHEDFCKLILDPSSAFKPFQSPLCPRSCPQDEADPDLKPAHAFDLGLSGHRHTGNFQENYGSTTFLGAPSVRMDDWWPRKKSTDFLIATVVPQSGERSDILVRRFRMFGKQAALMNCLRVVGGKSEYLRPWDAACAADTDLDGIVDCYYDVNRLDGNPADNVLDCPYSRVCSPGDLENCFDNCPWHPNPDQSWDCWRDDYDFDGVPNKPDNCQLHRNPDQADCDADGRGIECDRDDAARPCVKLSSSIEPSCTSRGSFMCCGGEVEIWARRFGMSIEKVHLSQCQCRPSADTDTGFDCDICGRSDLDDGPWHPIFWSGCVPNDFGNCPAVSVRGNVIWQWTRVPYDVSQSLPGDAMSCNRKLTLAGDFSMSPSKRYRFVLRAQPAGKGAAHASYREVEVSEVSKLFDWPGGVRTLQDPPLQLVDHLWLALESRPELLELDGWRVDPVTNMDTLIDALALPQARFDAGTARISLAADPLGTTAGEPDHSAAVRVDAPSGASAIYRFGGETSAGGLSASFRLSRLDEVGDDGGAAWSEITGSSNQPWPAARSGAIMAHDPKRNRLLLFGGRTSTGFSNDLWAYDFGEGKWSDLTRSTGVGVQGSLPPATAYPSGVAADGHWYIYGGLTPAGHSSAVFDWDFASETFAPSRTDPAGAVPARLSLASQTPPGRRGAAVALDRDNAKLLIYGGDSAAGGMFQLSYEGADLPALATRQLDHYGGGFHNVEGTSWRLMGSEMDGVGYSLSVPYLVTATRVSLGLRLAVKPPASEIELLSSAFGLALEREVSVVLGETGGEKFVALAGGVGPRHAVDWSRPHEYQLEIDTETDRVTLTIDGASALERTYSSFVAAARRRRVATPADIGTVHVGSGEVGDRCSETAGCPREILVFGMKVQWAAPGNYLNDVWSYDIAKGVWTEVAAQCDGEECPAGRAFARAHYLEGEVGGLMLVGGVAAPRREIEPVRILDLARPGHTLPIPRVIVSTFDPRDECSPLEPKPSEVGRLCTSGENWWDPVGTVTCGPGNRLVCTADAVRARRVERARLPWRIRGFDMAGDTVFVATYRGLALLDVAESAAPRLREVLRVGRVRDVRVRGDHAYLAQPAAVSVIHLATGEVVGRVFPDIGIRGLALSGDYLYAVGRRYLSVIEVSTPSRPQVVAQSPIRRGRDVALWGSYVVVADAHGLRTFTVGTEGELDQLALTPTDRRLYRFYIAGGGAYAVDRRFRPVYLDLTDPSHPAIAGSHSLTNLAAGRLERGKWRARQTDRKSIEIAMTDSRARTSLDGTVPNTVRINALLERY